MDGLESKWTVQGVKLDGLKEGNWTVKMDKSRWPKKLEVNGPKGSK